MRNEAVHFSSTLPPTQFRYVIVPLTLYFVTMLSDWKSERFAGRVASSGTILVIAGGRYYYQHGRQVRVATTIQSDAIDHSATDACM